MLYRVLIEARLRLLGFVLSQKIARDASSLLHNMTLPGKEAVVRCAAVSVVIAQRYHSNQVLLFFSFLEQLQNDLPHDLGAPLDDWTVFRKLLETLPKHERALVLDLMCVAAAFDGTISKMEREKMSEVFSRDEWELYHVRLDDLTESLRNGFLCRAASLSKIDFELG